MLGFGARLFNDDETAVILNSQEGIDGLQWLIDLEQKYKVAVPGGAVRKATEAQTLFLNKKSASFPSQGAGLKPAELDGVADFDWYWVPPPNVPGKDPAVLTNIHGHYVFQQKDQNRTDAALKWGQFLVRPEALALSLAQFGMPPALQSLWGAVTDENQKVGLHFTDIMIAFRHARQRRPDHLQRRAAHAPSRLQRSEDGQAGARRFRVRIEQVDRAGDPGRLKRAPHTRPLSPHVERGAEWRTGYLMRRLSREHVKRLRGLHGCGI